MVPRHIINNKLYTATDYITIKAEGGNSEESTGYWAKKDEATHSGLDKRKRLNPWGGL